MGLGEVTPTSPGLLADFKVGDECQVGIISRQYIVDNIISTPLFSYDVWYYQYREVCDNGMIVAIGTLCLMLIFAITGTSLHVVSQDLPKHGLKWYSGLLMDIFFLFCTAIFYPRTTMHQ